MLRSAALLVAFVASRNVGVAAALGSDSGNNNNTSHTSAVIGLILALVFLTLLCCGVQRRRAARASLSRPSYIAHPLPLSSASRFPHGLQYGTGTPPAMYTPPPLAAGSEYPAANAAEFAPPPYVKEESKPVYAPPPGPPPGISSPYSPPPGPPPRAHVRTSSHGLSGDFTNSGDFSGGFRPPPPP
ncbi:hypothetical protein C8R45DRAFT_1005811 [Mycena sanguinolenta]|nr:hypothetical protein C8R45DRAFT_1005811 [Mycena sanguinolenta]